MILRSSPNNTSINTSYDMIVSNNNNNINNNNNSNSNNSNKNKRSKIELNGIIQHLSPFIEYSSGYTIYIHIKSNDNDDYYIVLSGKQCRHYLPILSIGSSYTFKNVERRETTIDNINSLSCNDLSNYWIYATDKCEIVKLNNDNNNDVVDVYSIDQLLLIYPNLLEPSISDKIFYENLEFNVSGYIDEKGPYGIIKIIKSSSLANENERNRANGVKSKLKDDVDNSFYIFLTYNHVKAYDQRLIKGELITCYSIHPMYLWGTFVGFATSIRSHIQIDSEISTLKVKTKFLNDAYSIKNKSPLIVAWMFHLYQHLNNTTTTDSVANKILEKYVNILQDNYDSNERREFTDVLYTQLYYIRAGQDSDWLSSKLPSLWVPKRVRKFLKQSDFDSIRDVRSWKIRIIKSPLEEKSCSERMTGMTRTNVLVANIVEVISQKIPTINCTILRIGNKPPGVGVVSIVTFIIGNETKLRELNKQLSLLPVQQTYQKIVIKNFDVLHEIQPVELDESIEIPTYILAQAENVNIIGVDNNMVIEEDSTNMLEQKMYSVRHALMRRPHCAESPLGFFAGIVIKKDLVGAIDCHLLIRDLVDCDTITIRMKAGEANNIMSGLIISIRSSISCSISDEIIYKYDSTTKDAKIEIIGIDMEQFNHINDDLLRFPMQSYYSGKMKRILPRLPPRYRLSSLYMSKAFNRCMWTFLGQVTFVRMFGISLKCNKCLASYKIHQGPFECLVCHGRHLLPTWEAEVVFDDGSAECRLFVEGDDVFKLLEPESLQMRNKLLRLKDIVERLVHMHGSICYTSDNILINREKKESKEWCEDTFPVNPFDNNDEYQNLVETTDWTYNFKSNEKKKTKNDEDAIDAIKAIRNIQKMRPIIEICARIKGKVNQPPYLRPIKLQEDNSRLKFCNNQVTRQTLTNNHIELVCYSVKSIQSNDTVTEAYQILSKLG